MKNFRWLPIYNAAVEHELFVLVQRHLMVHGFAQMGLTVLVALSSWRYAAHEPLLLWTAFMFTSGLVLLAQGLYYRSQAPVAVGDMARIRRWRQNLRTETTLMGLGWGAVGFLLVPGNSNQNIMIMTAFAGVMGYAAAGNGSHDVVGFWISVVLANVIILPLLPNAVGSDAPMLAGMFILYMVVLIFVARNIFATVYESIRLRMENESLARSNAENAARAEQANRDKSEFLAAASHDLRQPVHALLLLIEAYRQQVPAAANHPLLRHIAQAGHSINTLFNALMELSRLESGAEKPILTMVDLPELTHRLLNRIRPEAQEKGLHIRCFETASAKHCCVHADKVLLERMLNNLLSNAVRYTEQGGVLLSLRTAHSGGLWLEVWDTGLGIAPADQGRIFAPYVQLGNRERDRSKGLGLGLAIVHHAAQLQGLGLTLRSRPGHGSRFRLHFPAAVCQRTLPEAEMLMVAPFPLMPRLQGRRVLLIDDDPMVLQAMQALLSSWQIDLRCACWGDARALDVCGTDWVPECVLCDFRLPGSLHGVAMLDVAQDRFPGVVGILQTGELAQAVQQQAEEAGYMVLYKPVSPGLLFSTLTAVLSPGIRQEIL